ERGLGTVAEEMCQTPFSCGKWCLTRELPRERRLERDLEAATQQIRYRALLLRFGGEPLELGVVEARHAPLRREMHLADHGAVERDRRVRRDLLGLVSLTVEIVRECHAVTRGMRGGDQLFRIRARRVLETGREREGDVTQHVARARDRAVPWLQRAARSEERR